MQPMSAKFDLVIRNGTLADGGGGEPREADVAVRAGRIAAVGEVNGVGAEEIDARGLLVTPGFVDIHTHYDGQATWDAHLEPSSSHGVTSVVMGNCGVGFAPCRPRDRDVLISLMEGVEDIPGTALAEGLKWDWESFPDYLDALERRARDIDIATQSPPGALRVYAMGARGAAREDATENDIACMRKLVDEGMRAGALGVASSRTMNHRTAAGDLTPMYGAAAREIAGLSDAIGRRGVFQLVSDFMDEAGEFALLEHAARGGALSASFSLLQADPVPDMWRSLLKRVENANARGLPIRAQVMCRPVGVLMGLDTSIHPFMKRPHYQEVAHLPLAARVAALGDPQRKTAILAEEDAGRKPPLGYLSQAVWKLFPLGDPPDYAPPASASFQARADASGAPPLELVYDYLLTDAGRALIFLPLFNFTTNTLDPVAEMLRHPLAVHGLGDGAAHRARSARRRTALFAGRARLQGVGRVGRDHPPRRRAHGRAAGNAGARTSSGAGRLNISQHVFSSKIICRRCWRCIFNWPSLAACCAASIWFCASCCCAAAAPAPSACDAADAATAPP